ncbi:MAG TPA: hypothetical protein VFT89_05235 [Rhizobiaceae bacterium]|nr:hypothetical protein [Rhizobiaceae bacterium]
MATPATLIFLAASWHWAISLAEASSWACATVITDSLGVLVTSAVGIGAALLSFWGAFATDPAAAFSSLGFGASVATPSCPVTACAEVFPFSGFADAPWPEPVVPARADVSF